MGRCVVVIHADEPLDEALEEITSNRLGWAPVVEAQALGEDRHVIGVVSVADMVRLYRETLTKGSRRMPGFVEGTLTQKVEVKPEMPLASRTLSEALIPTGCLVVSIIRGSELLFPRGSTVILPGDTITVLMNLKGERRWEQKFSQPLSSFGFHHKDRAGCVADYSFRYASHQEPA